MSADRDITPRVIAHIGAHLPRVPIADRVSPVRAQLVLRQLARWARQTDRPGHWTATESVGQLVAGTGIPARTAQKALVCLELLGLVVTVRHGGGQGVAARGSTRLLLLDPTGRKGTSAGNRREFNPELAPVLTGTSAGTAGTSAGTAGTSAGQQAHTASSSASSSARDTTADAIPDWLAQRWADKL